MTFDLVITTYNRPNEVHRLVNQALDCYPAPDHIIVVDSSDEVHPYLQNIDKVRYIRSSHKNQPYQRLLGAMVSANTDIIVFMDDDLSIIRNNIFEQLLNEFNNPSICGVSVGFNHENLIKKKLDIPIWTENNYFTKVFSRFTGVPKANSGEVKRLGIVGPKPKVQDFVHTFSGAIMAFRRDVGIKSIPEDLLALYERKLGKGEDKIISMLASQYGKLLYLPELYLNHPPNDSNYFQNNCSFARKVTYSRLYHSNIFAAVCQKPKWKEYIIFYYFSFWRLLISFFSLLLHPSRNRKNKVLGVLQGIWLTFTLPQKARYLTPHINWQTEIQKDLQHAGCT